MFDRLAEVLKELCVGIYYALLGGRDHSLKAGFDPVSKLLSRSKSHTGFTLGNKRLTADVSRKNCAVISPSGGGKTSTMLVNTILSLDVSMIINDPSGELKKTAPYLISQDFEVKTLFLGREDLSISYNPLSRIEKKSDVYKIASMLVKGRAGKEDASFWNLKAQELIGSMILFLWEQNNPTHLHLGQVFRLIQELQGSEATINALFSQKASDDVWRLYKSFMGANDNTRQSIIATAESFLNFCADPIIANQLSTDNIDFQSFRTNKIALFITASPTEIHYYAPVFSLFFGDFFKHIFQELPKKDDMDIYLLFDELATSLHLPDFGRIIAASRKYRIPIAYCIQSESQLAENFNKNNASSILANATTKVYFGGLETGEESGRLEKTLGSFDYKDEKGQIRTRLLMTADEIRNMKQNEVLIISHGLRPIKTVLKPFYQNADMIRKIKTEYPEDYNETVTPTTAAYLDLEPYQNQEDGEV